MKKKDKFKTIGQNPKIKNLKLNNYDDLHDWESSQDQKKKSTKKPLRKGESSLKSCLSLRQGRVVEIMTNYQYLVMIENEYKKCSLSGRLKYLDHIERNPIGVGDFVQVDERPHCDYRIEEISPRKNIFTRFIEKSQEEIILATNIDQIVVISSAKHPIFNANLLDRYLCLAEISQIPVLICINKIDLLDDRTEIINECNYYKKMGYPIVYTSTISGEGITELKELLKDKESLFTGKSGTGKSSIINTIEPAFQLKVGEISNFHQKGKHTTSFSRMITWNFGGKLIDTPGLKTLGLKRDDLPKVSSCFPGFRPYSLRCTFNNCSHLHEENCAVKVVINKDIPPERYASYVKIRGI